MNKVKQENRKGPSKKKQFCRGGGDLDWGGGGGGFSRVLTTSKKKRKPKIQFITSLLKERGKLKLTNRVLRRREKKRFHLQREKKSKGVGEDRSKNKLTRYITPTQ